MHIFLRIADKTINKLNILSYAFLLISLIVIPLLVINYSNSGGIKNILIFGSISSLFLIFFAITRSLTSSLKQDVKHIYDEGYAEGTRNEMNRSINDEENDIFKYLNTLNSDKFPNITRVCSNEDQKIMLIDGLLETINDSEHKKEVIDRKIFILENSLNTLDFNSDKFQKQLWRNPTQSLESLGYLIIDRFYQSKSSPKK